MIYVVLNNSEDDVFCLFHYFKNKTMQTLTNFYRNIIEIYLFIKTQLNQTS
jgi:hypothetical protein